MQEREAEENVKNEPETGSLNTHRSSFDKQLVTYVERRKFSSAVVTADD